MEVTPVKPEAGPLALRPLECSLPSLEKLEVEGLDVVRKACSMAAFPPSPSAMSSRDHKHMAV